MIKTKSLEIVVNCELCKVYSWLTGNTFILNIKKSMLFSDLVEKNCDI